MTFFIILSAIGLAASIAGLIHSMYEGHYGWTCFFSVCLILNMLGLVSELRQKDEKTKNKLVIEKVITYEIDSTMIINNGDTTKTYTIYFTK